MKILLNTKTKIKKHVRKSKKYIKVYKSKRKGMSINALIKFIKSKE